MIESNLDQPPLGTTTEIVYVCSPDWQHYLFTSLRSLLASQSSFDRIVIYCVGKRPREWEFEDSRIQVEEVNPLIDGYFLSNKIYACQRPVDRIIFLDADTMVLKPLDALYDNVSADFIGRLAALYENEDWNQQEWDNTLTVLGGKKGTPYFNSGVTIFQNAAQRRIEDLWLDFTRKILSGDLMPSQPNRFAEQLGLSLALGAEGLSFHLLGRTEHAYGWRKEPYENAVVFHKSGPFLPIATEIEIEYGLANLDLPSFRRVNGINSIKLHRKIRHMRARFRKIIEKCRGRASNSV